ncbi:MAG: hypothetical protein GXZ15_04405 [Campylobacter sp.]|nr:hypothetical protein [Campylobacter sp.]
MRYFFLFICVTFLSTFSLADKLDPGSYFDAGGISDKEKMQECLKDNVFQEFLMYLAKQNEEYVRLCKANKRNEAQKLSEENSKKMLEDLSVKKYFDCFGQAFNDDDDSDYEEEDEYDETMHICDILKQNKNIYPNSGLFHE